eukprot:TRINITY_DN100_c0_g3_i1.p2 TRINITY_DN100_c0_g3~~TRINITY_DN100_c0_g3_i1.p2  ORF type:complete len:747 (+),score=299.39 TRINITY_DN100_c0_g3_i1:90-2330(+)
MPAIVWTMTDEAPALATYSLLPVVRAFTAAAGVEVELRDISLAGRILAAFPESLRPEQRQRDALAELGELAKTPAANIVKLPNISASIPQLVAAIAELNAKGYAVPPYPKQPKDAAEKEIKARYAKVLGSAVNPVLREGNSDRRVAAPVKQYAQRHPHKLFPWSPGSGTHVASMVDGDFFSSEQSSVAPTAGAVRIELVAPDGSAKVLKEKVGLLPGEIIDATRMRCRALCDYLEREMQDARARGLLLSLHLKATMMKVSDPIIFGHAVKVFFRAVFEKHGELFARLGVDANNGLGDVYAKIASLPAAQRAEVEADIKACYGTRPALAMVDSDRGITNLHVPSDVIIDASMPPMIRDSGKMYGPDGKLHDTKALIPDRCYAGIYQATIDHCRTHGAFDVATMGNVCNVGLMAQKAEEYGSHDKTFEIPHTGTVRVVDSRTGAHIFSHDVERGDIWRMCQTKDAAVRDWVKLAVTRARATGSPAIFWLTPQRAHDRVLIGKVREYLEPLDTAGLDIRILPPVEAAEVSLQRAREGKDTISVTGNVLRDYLTDLFPILELGTSAKMLSIVPLLAGGGLFETGAGGSAPKHVQQFQKEGHLRWDSLGEYLALAVSLEDLAAKTGNARAKVLADALNSAVGQWLNSNRTPSRKVREIDNRGSTFYLALYWAQALAAQTQDAALRSRFAPLAQELAAREKEILAELNAPQGRPADVGGYYKFDDAKADREMRPSALLNEAMRRLGATPAKL